MLIYVYMFNKAKIYVYNFIKTLLTSSAKSVFGWHMINSGII